jgi:hypothetical protein
MKIFIKYQETEGKKLQNILLQTTQVYESMARIFYEAKMQKDGDVTLPISENNS